MPPESKAFVLMIEDDADAAFLLKRLLQKTGLPLEVKHLSDGSKALQYFDELEQSGDRAHAAQPLLVLLDIKMPKVNGFEVLTRIRAQAQPHRPVAIVSTSDDPKDRQRAADLGADAFLTKFPSTEELAALITPLLAPRSAEVRN
jgi:CheY-like chemotaxis protein